MATELRAYIKAIKDNVFIAQNLKYPNELLFALIRYVNSEQPSVDWLSQPNLLKCYTTRYSTNTKSTFEKDPYLMM